MVKALISLRIIIFSTAAAFGPTAFAAPIDQVADSLEIVGILGDHNAGRTFNGLVVLRLSNGHTLFLEAGDSIPGYPNIKVVKVENRRVFIGAAGEDPVALTWQEATAAQPVEDEVRFAPESGSREDGTPDDSDDGNEPLEYRPPEVPEWSEPPIERPSRPNDIRRDSFIDDGEPPPYEPSDYGDPDDESGEPRYEEEVGDNSVDYESYGATPVAPPPPRQPSD